MQKSIIIAKIILTNGKWFYQTYVLRVQAQRVLVLSQTLKTAWWIQPAHSGGLQSYLPSTMKKRVQDSFH